MIFACQLYLTCLCYSFDYRSYGEIVDSMKSLHALYPELVELSSIQKDFNVKSKLNCGSTLCEQWYLRIFNKRIHPSSRYLPQLFISGELHGDERVAPNAALEFAILLLQNRAYYDPSYENKLQSNVFREFPKANFHQHLAFLVDTREIVIMPMSNPYGYFRSQRTEQGIDVNRDFPFDYSQGPYPCLRSESSRGLQLLFSHNMFLATITYHGGQRSITYEWGDTYNNRLKSLAPDHNAMKDIAAAMNHFSSGEFDVGSSNDKVYPVRGGMEEWGYAASWFNRYNKVKTVPQMCDKNISVLVTDTSNRCLVFLIETDRIKIPQSKALGNNENVFSTAEKSRDHLFSVLIRQMTVLLDVIRPYSFILDAFPTNVTWTVGGCFAVDESVVLVFPYEEAFAPFLQQSNIPSDLTDPEYELLNKLIQTKTPLFSSPVYKGDSALRRIPSSSFNPGIRQNQLIFNTPFHFNGSVATERVVILTRSVTDGFMGKQPPRSNPPIPPQSLFVNMRTQLNWTVKDETIGKELRSRRYIISRPVDIWISHHQDVVEINDEMKPTERTTIVQTPTVQTPTVQTSTEQTPTVIKIETTVIASSVEDSANDTLVLIWKMDYQKHLPFTFYIVLTLCWLSLCCFMLLLYCSE